MLIFTSIRGCTLAFLSFPSVSSLSTFLSFLIPFLSLSPSLLPFPLLPIFLPLTFLILPLPPLLLLPPTPSPPSLSSLPHSLLEGLKVLKANRPGFEPVSHNSCVTMGKLINLCLIFALSRMEQLMIINTGNDGIRNNARHTVPGHVGICSSLPVSQHPPLPSRPSRTPWLQCVSPRDAATGRGYGSLPATAFYLVQMVVTLLTIIINPLV